MQEKWLSVRTPIRNPWSPDRVRGDKSGFRRILAVFLLALAGCGAPGTESKIPEVPRVFPPPPALPSYVFERSLYDADDLTTKATGSGFLATLVGARSGNGQGLSRPTALAAYQGRVAVVNSLDASISLFDLAQRQFSRFELADTGAQRAPVGVSVDRNGFWYVADGLGNYVLVLDPQGRFQRKMGGPSWLLRLVNVAVDSDAQRVYAIDQAERQHRVRVFHAVTGSHLMDIGHSGDGPGEFNLPVDAAVGRDGRLYVVDSGNYRVQIFDQQGQYLKSFGTAGKRPGQFSRPKEIATDAQGLVYVVDATFGHVQVFDPDGGYQYVIGARGDQGAGATYMLPSGVAVDTDGHLYVLDQWYVKLDVYRPVRHRVQVKPLQQ